MEEGKKITLGALMHRAINERPLPGGLYDSSSTRFSILGPLSYEPNTLPLRHRAVRFPNTL
jgi:hypothetical protein